ncbi:MAG: hypothetical protein FWD89_00005, partial [Firmicutes bacterium]|nr:hypothetical protein [Bacillota bacterium]
DLKRLSEIKTELGEEIKKVKAALIELCDWQEGKCLFQRQRGSAYTCCTTTFVCKQLDEDKGCTLDDEERPLLCDLFLCVPAIEALMEKVKAFNSGDDSVREELDFLKDYIKMCILLNKEQLPIYKEYFDATVIRECKNPCAKKCTKPYLKSAEVVGTGEFF